MSPWLLTPTQRHVLQLVAGGLSTAEIGQALNIRRLMVQNHLHAIFDALRVRGRLTAVLEAIRLGEIDELRAYEDLEGRRRVE